MSDPKPTTRRPRGRNLWDEVKERLDDFVERLFPSPRPEPIPIPVRRR